MLGSERLERLADRALAMSRADETEVVLIVQDSALTRFAQSRIHQNVSESNVELRVRVLVGKRVGVATTNDLNIQSLRQVTERALQLARLQPENPELAPLPDPQPITQVASWSVSTREFGARQRAQAVSTICRLANEKGLEASGAFSTSASELLVANSRGIHAYAPSTLAELTTVVMSADSSGFAQDTVIDVAALDAERLGREAVDKALTGRHPQPLSPGKHTVILEPYAVAELLAYLAYLGLGARAFQEGRSFMTGQLGRQITGEQITVWDDGSDPTGLPFPFDFEGLPRRRVELITNGVARGVVYDSQTAFREHKFSTGHALPAPDIFGPLPVNLFLQPGSQSVDQMLAAVDHGVWVTRLHYVNPVHPLNTVVTGMTRDGTFWIERGEIRNGIKNLRFTQSILDAFRSTCSVGTETRLLPGMVGGIRAPALLIDGFSPARPSSRVGWPGGPA